MPKAQMHASPCLCGCIRGKLGPEEDQFLTPASLVVHQVSGLNFPTCKQRWVSACFRMTLFCVPASSGPTPAAHSLPKCSSLSEHLLAFISFSARLCSIHSQRGKAGRAQESLLTSETDRHPERLCLKSPSSCHTRAQLPFHCLPSALFGIVNVREPGQGLNDIPVPFAGPGESPAK